MVLSRNKEGLLSLQAIIGLVIGVILTIILLNIGGNFWDTLFGGSTDKATLESFERIGEGVVNVVVKSEDAVEGEIVQEEIPIQISEDYYVIGFSEDKDYLNLMCSDVYSQMDVVVDKPCEGSCLCLCKDYGSGKIICMERSDVCVEFEDFSFGGFCNGHALVKGEDRIMSLIVSKEGDYDTVWLMFEKIPRVVRAIIA
tara:strand:- start:747 stop:1343 length:597 start_codon:yes stop_codon:yes gene_type:complete